MSPGKSLGVISLVAAACCSVAMAQPCEAEWQGIGSESSYGVDDDVLAITGFDDGQGHAIYVAGRFTEIGGRDANRIAKWDSEGWSALGSGIGVEYPHSVNDMAVYDDGTGAALFAGGAFDVAGGQQVSNVAMWDGQAWDAMDGGVNGGVTAFAVFDDGSGPALYVGGGFSDAGGQPVSNVARWDGQAWDAMDGGVTGGVTAFAVFDDGSGPALYVSGGFGEAGGLPASGIAKWDGISWHAVGEGLPGGVTALATIGDGSGSALYAGGYFEGAADGQADYVAKWTGSAWTPAEFSITNAVTSMVSADLGDGEQLYLSGFFAPSDETLARWDGSALSYLEGGILSTRVRALAAYDDGSDAGVYLGGGFSSAWAVLRWDGNAWQALGAGLDGAVNDMIMFDDGLGEQLYLGGSFRYVDGVEVNGIVGWDGQSWSSLDGGVAGSPYGGAEVHALAVFDDGTGPALYAGGEFTEAGGTPAHSIAKWDGAQWHPVASDVVGGSGRTRVLTLEALEDDYGISLYVGGHYTFVDNIVCRSIARWDGSAWSPLGSGVERYDDGLTAGTISDITRYENGDETLIVAAGRFEFAGGMFARNIAGWNGETWQAIGEGVSYGAGSPARALEVIRQGDNEVLIVGGSFLAAGFVLAPGIAMWDGDTWSSLGGGIGGEIYSLEMFDDGGGPALYAGGSFESAGASAASNIAKWDGSEWTPVGGGLERDVLTLLAHDADGDGAQPPVLYAGGGYHHPSGDLPGDFAIYEGCAIEECLGDTNGDRVVDFSDLNAVLVLFGEDGDLAGDLDGDGTVGFSDLNEVLVRFGQSCE